MLHTAYLKFNNATILFTFADGVSVLQDCK